MKHNFSDLTLDLTESNTPVSISIFRGQDYDHFQQALEDGATYSVKNDLDDICNLKLSHFELAGAMSAGDMFGQPEIMYAVHDDAQLFFECESTELTEEFVEEYRMQFLMHRNALEEKEELKGEEYRATILGWNSIHGGSFAVNYTYPATFSKEELDEATTAFIQDISRDHAEDEAGSEDFLFITNILSGHQADDFKPFGHTEGHDQYNFPQMPKWEYKLLSGSVLWCGGDYGTVEAHTESDALELAKEELATHFAEVNRRLQGFDTFEFSDDDIEVMAV